MWRDLLCFGNVTYLPGSQHWICSCFEVSKRVCECIERPADSPLQQTQNDHFCHGLRKSRTDRGQNINHLTFSVLPQWLKTREACTWSETDAQITQRSCYLAFQEKSTRPIASTVLTERVKKKKNKKKISSRMMAISLLLILGPCQILSCVIFVVSGGTSLVLAPVSIYFVFLHQKKYCMVQIHTN